MGTWIGGAIFQTTFTRADAPLLVDWVDERWGGPFALYCRMSFFLPLLHLRHSTCSPCGRLVEVAKNGSDLQYGVLEIQCFKHIVIGSCQL